MIVEEIVKNPYVKAKPTIAELVIFLQKENEEIKNEIEDFHLFSELYGLNHDLLRTF